MGINPTEAPPDPGASFRICPPTAANIRFFAGHLQAGGLLAIPTETVYGLAADARSPEACQRIFSLKGRPLLDPLIVHLADVSQLPEFAHPNEAVARIAEACWPGPLTVVLPKKSSIPDLITAGKTTVAIRIPAHPVAQNLLQTFAGPLAAPSANPFGYLSPTLPQHVTNSFRQKSPWVLDGGECAIGLESTILDLSRPETPAILRPGHFSAHFLSSLLDTTIPQHYTIQPGNQPASAPGTFARHYSPHTKLALFHKQPPSPNPPPDTARVLLQRPAQASSNLFWLSEQGDQAEAARSLYQLLRQLDNAGYQRIECELPKTDSGIAAALRDRLHRAAAP